MTPAEANLRILLGLFLVVAGAVGYRFARPIASFTEHVDAIGSKRRGKIEPAEWKVSLYRICSASGAAVGLLLLVLGLLVYL